MSLKPNNKESPMLKETIEELTKISRENDNPFWRDIAKRLNGSRKNYASLNLGKIDKLIEDGEIVVVPGSLLGAGYFEKKATLSALKFSRSAQEKIKQSGSTLKTLVELAREHPKGTNLKILR
ncbi:MAG: 50S ribosomal protein L18e [Candidatus Thermoplasmatota archaeon]|nr:50S ribosomal protein L18e [Candidatus Thermoplasmatota archaeon]MCL6091149.1 50S ribosomal protein L18e [Candidatus Thermoplasmatota archaeon]MDA8143984.1 50S ribosomal protein L18e [Thermoplasmatales archaeon]